MTAYRTVGIAAVLIQVAVLSNRFLFVLSVSAPASEYDRPASEDKNCLCEFPKHNNRTTDAALNRLKPLCGRRYHVEDEEYTYVIGICIRAEESTTTDRASAGAIQTHKGKTLTEEAPHIVGNYKRAELMTGSSWMILEYEGGDEFHGHCAKEARRTVIMVLCKPGEKTGNIRWVEENNNKSGDCYYLFEIDHEAACSEEKDTRLSIGSVICIVFFTVIGVYLILGVLYMRCIHGAKGLNQIPNYRFWRDFGALQSDGCNLVCRCGDQQPESKYYHGIGDHQIESANDIEDRDDHLLPM